MAINKQTTYKLYLRNYGTCPGEISITSSNSSREGEEYSISVCNEKGNGFNGYVSKEDLIEIAKDILRNNDC